MPSMFAPQAEDEEDTEEEVCVLLLMATYAVLAQLDDRSFSQIEHSLVIPSSWWERIDTLEHDLSGLFYNTFRMNRYRFGVLVDLIKNRWLSLYKKPSFDSHESQPGNTRPARCRLT